LESVRGVTATAGSNPALSASYSSLSAPGSSRTYRFKPVFSGAFHKIGLLNEAGVDAQWSAESGDESGDDPSAKETIVITTKRESEWLTVSIG
jgi:hypothetical protein